ncbi:MAG: T9SS type A sorting domain-containing protein, partial [Pontibacter sp.]|nr:T9SS type A sorting domain-containing protein [Pontibacter sp.]
RAAGENVGSYAISKGAYTYGSNYAETFEGANLVIGQRAITITAPSMSKYCGQIDPLTGYICSVSGAVNGEVITTSYSFSNTTVIPASTDSKLSNYDVTYNNGTLSINGLTLDASNASNPRSIHEDVTITVTVKDGNTDVAGVSVKLLFDGVVKGTAVSDVNGKATFALGKLPVNVYAVTAEAGNACSVSQVAYLPVYDPDGGFVTGGGWINSPKGALAGSDVTGKANFGFVAKYKKGKNEVEGNTEFQFQAGGVNFKSSVHNAGSLVISGAKATYKGTGMISGDSEVYEFMVVATDAQVNGGGEYDRFRIKIWKGGYVLYDNARGELENADLTGDGTRLGGGSIVIHENKSVGKTSTSTKLITESKPALEEQGSFYNYPNAFSDRTTIAFSFDKVESYALEVYDVKGALVKKVSAGVAEANKLYEFEVDGRSMAEGIYIARLVTSSRSQSIKMILKK